MAHELWLLKESSMTNITPLIGSISWRSNKDELGDEISFNIAFNDTKFFPVNPCDLGDIVVLMNDGAEITRAVIVDETKNGRSPISYTAFDYAYYLNKSSAVYQFNKMKADAAINKILGDFGIPIGNIASLPSIITKIYNNKVVIDIIKEIVEFVQQETGQQYLIDMEKGKFNIRLKTDLTVEGTFSLFDGGTEYDVTSAISAPSKKRSIADMINSIQVVGNDDKVVLSKQDDAMVSKFGVLQKVVTLDQNTKKTAAQVAQSELDALSKIVEDISVTLLGDDRVRAGRLFSITEPITGISGTYLISDVTHSISNSVHTMQLNLEVV